MAMTAPVITIFVRHSGDCKYKGDEFEKRCRCRKHLRYSLHGKQVRHKAGTRSWAEAEEKKRELEDQLAGRVPASKTLEGKTLAECVKSFTADKTAQGVSARVVTRYALLLSRLQSFCENRGLHTPALALTYDNLTAFRGTWDKDWPSSYTRKVMQFHLVHFLHTAHDAGWIEKVPRLKAIQTDDTPETEPLTDAEYKALLKHAKGKTHTCIQLMRWSGLAVRDASTLKRTDLTEQDGIHKIIRKRTKTGTPLYIPIPPDVAAEVLAVLNGNPVYVFWTPRTEEPDAYNWAQVMGQNISAAFKDAGIRTEGHLISHRLRATFAVDLLQKGVPLEHVSKLLGHTSVTTTERHYARWVKGRQVLLDNLVSATWKGRKS